MWYAKVILVLDVVFFKTHEHAFELKRHDKDKIKLLRLKYLQHAKKIKGIAFD